jgi:chromosome segregation ATPase
MRLRETSNRCEALEEDLSEVHKHLQERIKESTTMRRLLNESQGSEERKLREATESIKALTEERDRLENESVVASLKRSRELEDLRTKIKGLEESLAKLSDERTRYRLEVEELEASRGRTKTKIELEQKELEESRQVIERLGKALETAEVGIRESEKANVVLRKVTEETQQKLERAQKNQKTLANDVRVLQNENVRLQSDLRSASGSPTAPGSSPASPVRENKSKSTSVNLPYLKNILFSFLERKDHREEMIPVLSQLLHFEGNDQDRFWNAFSK